MPPYNGCSARNTLKTPLQLVQKSNATQSVLSNVNYKWLELILA